MTNISTVLGSAPEPTAELVRLKSFARACCQAGLYLMLIEPGTKTPVDMRSDRQRREEDGVAKDAARMEGRADWDRVKSKGGVYLATDDPIKISRYLDRYRKTYGAEAAVNFAIDVGRSGLIVVDCDTREQVQQFLAYVADANGLPPGEDAPDIPPTVKTPGQVDSEGTWAHKDGGHFYFRASGPQPERSGSITMPGGWVILWANRYVLIPPSVRPEGRYRLVGQDYPAPDWLEEIIEQKVLQLTQRRLDALENTDLSDAVNQWAAETSWDDLLAPAGWALTARQDNCGCDIWTAPGDHASPKSATAHDTQCSLGRYTPDNAPLHIWTDYPGEELEQWMATRGGKTLSRLQVAAVLEYGGDVGKAMRSMNVMPAATASLSFGADISRELGAGMGNLDDQLIHDPEPPEEEVAAPDPFLSPGSAAGTTEETATPVATEDKPISGVPNIQPFDYWRDIPPPQFAIEGLLEHRGLTSLVGAPGIGKSGIALDIAAALVTGNRWMGRETLRQRVLYLPGEGLSGAVQRIKAWESAHDMDLGGELFVGDSIIQIGASTEAWAAVVEKMIRYEIGLLMLDTFARAAVGLEENSATDVGKAIARFGQVQMATGAGLMVIHHTKKDSTSGRGSSALFGALDTELLVREGTWWDGDDGPPPGRPLEVEVTKQKNAEQPLHGIPMLAIKHASSFIMTGPSGILNDPLDGVLTPRAVIPESIVNVAIRLQDYAQRFTQQGLTRGEFAYGIPMDDFTAQRRDQKTAWRMKVNEAVDLGLRYGLLQTLTGTATGARYVPDVMTADAARAQWAKEGMGGD
jgi:hypothetical protein